ncbi:MAG: 3-oxoacyl-[acyl-carrier-protein] reductase [Coriobacteriales bacterium]|jgi:3-oxoacyl-[acyl-carrier protein] reductase|nr:3-oxoacyl-[acyl-carrier-protein] reductase [Coriobacteriales bacterium]
MSTDTSSSSIPQTGTPQPSTPQLKVTQQAVARPQPNTTSQSDPRVALVTGGSRGIGRAISIALASRGIDVAINFARNADEAAHTATLCQQAAQAAGFPNCRFITIGGNVAEQADCEQIHQSTVEALGAPDILVNNAGITRDNLIMRMSVEDFDTVLDVNLRAAFIFSKLVSRAMVKKRYGRIVSISSVVGLAGNAGQTNYAASKAGVIGLTKALAKELGPRNITANAVAPGFIETDMTDALGEEARSALINSMAIPRLGSTEDVARLVAFLTSDEAAYITGQVIAVDGGMAL